MFYNITDYQSDNVLRLAGQKMTSENDRISFRGYVRCAHASDKKTILSFFTSPMIGVCSTNPDYTKRSFSIWVGWLEWPLVGYFPITASKRFIGKQRNLKNLSAKSVLTFARKQPSYSIFCYPKNLVYF